LFSPEWFTALGSVIIIDLVMSGDNAIIVGLAAAGLPPELRRKAIDLGMLTLRASGLRKVAAGHTSIEEVLKETVK